MKGRNIKITVIALIAGTLLPIQSQALSPFLQRPATTWGHTYASGEKTTSPQVQPKVAYATTQSKFNINYKNFPEWAKSDLKAAVDVWSTYFQSAVTITIDATWLKIGDEKILGSARPGDYFAGFDKAPDPSLWYPSALANAITGKDLDPDHSEMIIQVNSLADWKVPNDGIADSNQYDLQSVFLHEMGHGLGFLSEDKVNSLFGIGSIEQPTPFAAYAVTNDGRRLADFPTPSRELFQALTSPLSWSGPLGIAANGGVKPLLYTPSRYEEGSSVSHLDEATFSNTDLDRVMTPNLDAGEIFHQPGPLMLAMMEDMRRKPPAGIAVGIPDSVRNPSALVSDGGALITFEPPTNARTAQVTSYTVRNIKTNQTFSGTSSPIRITGLKNGTSYSFTVIASNSNGSSTPIATNPVTPQPVWTSSTIDNSASISRIVDNSFNGAPVLLYIDKSKGYLKFATWDGKRWIKKIVDGGGGSSGRTRNPISGALSTCVSGNGKRQILHIFYADSVSQDLRYAKYDGKSFVYDVVDGNALTINNYEDPNRVRTASDVSVSSACVATANSVQVFYRDESQGILLGATKLNSAKEWRYELVDGDRKTDGRTTGDVAFHLSAIFDGKKSFVLYDSVFAFSQKKEVTTGEIRIATRSDVSPTSWKYQTFEATTPQDPVAGFDVALAKSIKGVFATWMLASSTSLPRANRVRWSYVSDTPGLNKVETDSFGTPSKYLSTDTRMISYNCQTRLCAIDLTKSTPKTSLVSTTENPEGIASAWVTVNRVTYLVAGLGDRLVALRPAK